MRKSHFREQKKRLAASSHRLWLGRMGKMGMRMEKRLRLASRDSSSSFFFLQTAYTNTLFYPRARLFLPRHLDAHRLRFWPEKVRAGALEETAR